jgi:hypothetical protein
LNGARLQILAREALAIALLTAALLSLEFLSASRLGVPLSVPNLLVAAATSDRDRTDSKASFLQRWIGLLPRNNKYAGFASLK